MPDVIVLGVGAMGAAACRALARRGLAVVGLEQFLIAHDRGSSHGDSRIIRQAYFEHPDYVPLLRRAYAQWAELEQERGESLFHRCGLLLVGSPAGVVIHGVRQAAAEHALQIEEVARADVARRFPGFRMPEDALALFEADAGWLPVERCVEVLVESARAAGADIRSGARVREWRADERGVCVRVDSGEKIRAEHLVIAAGAWASRALQSAHLPLAVRRKVQLWFETSNSAHRAAAGAPVFCFALESGFYYGFPASADGTMKIARHDGGEPVDDPAAVDRGLHAEDVEPVRAFARLTLPGVRTEVCRHSVCMYTMTPDEHFIVDHHPQYSRVVLAAGFSGHGFKFAPLVGTLLADMVSEAAPDPAAAFLNARRFRASLPARS